MNNELIEKLKNNRIPWRWLDEESKEFIKNSNGYIILMDSSGDWHATAHNSFLLNSIVRIHKDYKTIKSIERFEIDSFAHRKLNEIIDAVNKLMEERK